jgi:hypothetical protein
VRNLALSHAVDDAGFNPATAYQLQQINPITFGRTEQAQVNKYRDL